jgi:hypothetical protein
MIYEHGLISVGTMLQETLPSGARLFIEVEGVLRKVKKIYKTKRGLHVISSHSRLPVNEDDILVISYYDLAGADAVATIKNSRVAALPLQELPQLEYTDSNYAGIHCG